MVVLVANNKPEGSNYDNLYFAKKLFYLLQTAMYDNYKTVKKSARCRHFDEQLLKTKRVFLLEIPRQN